MNGYVCFYRGKRVEVTATSSYAAQQAAATLLRVKSRNQHEIAVVLAEKSGEPVVHVAVD